MEMMLSVVNEISKIIENDSKYIGLGTTMTCCTDFFLIPSSVWTRMSSAAYAWISTVEISDLQHVQYNGDQYIHLKFISMTLEKESNI